MTPVTSSEKAVGRESESEGVVEVEVEVEGVKGVSKVSPIAANIC